jgi:hypothetical protein
VSDPNRFDARELFRALAHHDVEYVTIGCSNRSTTHPEAAPGGMAFDVRH